MSVWRYSSFFGKWTAVREKKEIYFVQDTKIDESFVVTIKFISFFLLPQAVIWDIHDMWQGKCLFSFFSNIQIVSVFFRFIFFYLPFNSICDKLSSDWIFFALPIFEKTIGFYRGLIRVCSEEELLIIFHFFCTTFLSFKPFFWIFLIFYVY